MTKKEEFEKRCGVKCFRNRDYQGFVWSWIENEIRQAKIKENRELYKWADDRYEMEVKNRPDINVHKNMLKQTWNQILIKVNNRISELEKEK